MQGTTRLRQLLAQPGTLIVPGAHSAMTARIVEAEGFEAVYLGGYACAASAYGIPDHSLVTMTELLAQVRNAVAAVDIPIIADMDDAGGTPLNVRRTVRACERAGLAGMHIEDLLAGKHFIRRKDVLVSKKEGVARIRAAVDARTDPDFVIIARSDAITVTTLDDAVDRARAYAEAGADLVMLPFLNLEDAPVVAEALPVPLLILATQESRAVVEQSGAKVVLYPATSVMVAYRAVREAWRALREQGVITGYRDRTPRPREFAEFIGMMEATELAEAYGMLEGR